MTPRNRKTLAERVTRAVELALAESDYVTCIDVMVGIGWLDAGAVKRWQQGQVDSLEQLVQVNSQRLAEALGLFRAWASGKGLRPSETAYVARTPRRQTLRFSSSGDAAIEQSYRTHWVSPALSEARRQRLEEKAARPPELLVIQPRNHDWTCHRCGGTGGLLVMEDPGPACLTCVGLGDLEFLGAGDALLTRRAKSKSPRHAVVVRFSKTRGRYERQGIMVEPQALAAAQADVDERADAAHAGRRSRGHRAADPG